MTKKDFIAIAEILWTIDDRELRLAIARQFAEYLPSRNHRFNRQRFIDHSMNGVIR